VIGETQSRAQAVPSAAHFVGLNSPKRARPKKKHLAAAQSAPVLTAAEQSAETEAVKRTEDEWSGSAAGGGDGGDGGPPMPAFPECATEPKVYVPFVVHGDQPPRTIMIQRKKNLYAKQDILALMEERGVESDYEAPLAVGSPSPFLLALQHFDDDDFEERSAEEWLRIGGAAEAGPRGEDGLQMMTHGLPAKSLKKDAKVKGGDDWLECRVVGFNFITSLWSIEWLPVPTGGDDEVKYYVQVPRIDLCFSSENPFSFADRVARAHIARRTAIECMRHNLYVDCMPTQELPQVDTERQMRLLTAAINTPALARARLDSEGLMSEVNKDYMRTLNRICLGARMAVPPAPDRSTLGPMFAGATSAGVAGGAPAGAGAAAGARQPTLGSATRVAMLDTLSADAAGTVQAPPPPERGVLAIAAHEFAKSYSDFAFHSFLTSPRIIDALSRLRTECNKALDTKLFKTDITKTITLEDFDSMQAKTLEKGGVALRDTWTNTVKGVVRNHLKHIEKGWFNLQESSFEIYQLGKLRKFLAGVNFMMQVKHRRRTSAPSQ
jgi:dynein heavy chain